MSTTNAVTHTSQMIADLKEQQKECILNLQEQIKLLREEIRIIEEFHDRLDDL